MGRAADRSSLPDRLVSLIERLIADGTFAPGSRLPPERELGRRFDVGRSTLRLALAELEGRGLVDRHQGRGTFVARSRIDADATQHFTLSAALRATGGVVRTETLSTVVARPSASVARDLDVPEGGDVVRIERLRRLDGEPVIVERTEVPASRFAGLEAVVLGERSLYDVLRERYGCVVAAADETLEPVVLTAAEAALLGGRRGAPALLVRRVTSDAEGRPFEFATALVRGDRSRLLLQRRVDGPVTAGTWAGGPRLVLAGIAEPPIGRPAA
jgi:GntR family transcriptional regulator